MTPDVKSLPWELGKSPFQIKGNNYRGSFKQYDQLVPGGHKAVIAAVDPELRAFVSQEFFTGNWYDIHPMVHMDATGARLAGQELDAFLRAGCEMQAKMDINGIYKMVLKFLSPETAIKKLAAFTGQYFNFAKHSVSINNNSAAFVTTEVPGDIGLWFCKAMGYYVGQVIRHSGASDTTFVFHDSVKSGKAHGVDLVTLHWEMRWTR